MRQLLRFCLDPRVLVAFGALAVAIWLVAPSLLYAAIPALIALACPVSMAVMAWTMRPGKAGAGPRAADAVRAELARLDARRAELEAELTTRTPSGPDATPPARSAAREIAHP
jgi:hypothetical protein